MSEQTQRTTKPTDCLRVQWMALFGSQPPAGLGHDLLARAVAHRSQEQAYVALSKATVAKLARLGEQFNRTKRRSTMIKAGTQLIREWQGKTYLVTALGEAFEYEGDRYASLSEVAGVITGTNWSGPKFFGLKSAAAASNRDKTYD